MRYKDVRKGVVRNAPKYIKCGKSYPSKQSCFPRLVWAKVGERFTPPTQHLYLVPSSNRLGGLPLTQIMGVRVPLGLHTGTYSKYCYLTGN